MEKEVRTACRSLNCINSLILITSSSPLSCCPSLRARSAKYRGNSSAKPIVIISPSIPMAPNQAERSGRTGGGGIMCAPRDVMWSMAV